MTQNEMKAMRGMPQGVRLSERLDIIARNYPVLWTCRASHGLRQIGQLKTRAFIVPGHGADLPARWGVYELRRDHSPGRER